MPFTVRVVAAIGRVAQGDLTTRPAMESICSRLGGRVIGGVGSSTDPIIAEFADKGKAAEAASQLWYRDDVEMATVGGADEINTTAVQESAFVAAIAQVAEGKSVTEVVDALLAAKSVVSEDMGSAYIKFPVAELGPQIAKEMLDSGIKWWQEGHLVHTDPIPYGKAKSMSEAIKGAEIVRVEEANGLVGGGADRAVRVTVHHPITGMHPEIAAIAKAHGAHHLADTHQTSFKMNAGHAKRLSDKADKLPDHRVRVDSI